MTFFKEYLSELVIGALLVVIIILSVKTCKKSPISVPVGDTTRVISIDTFYMPTDTIKIPTYQPGSIVVIHDGPSEDISTNYDELLKEYWKVADAYYSTNFTDDSIKLNDSTGKDVGSVLIRDSVRENQITSRSIEYNLKFPIITKTITNTVEVEKKATNKLFLGGGIIGNKNDYFSGASAALLFQNKKDGILGAGVIVDNRGNLNYQIHKYWKLGRKK